MLRFHRPDRIHVVFIGLVILSFVLATYDVQTSQVGGLGQALRNGAEAIFTPIQKVAGTVTRPVVGFIDGVANLASLRSENEALQEEVGQLIQELADTESLRARLAELEKIHNLQVGEGIDTITARIFAVGPSGFDNVRGIDKGSDDGIGVGMPVVDERGLVGRIDAVFPNSARVRLITDPSVKVGVRVGRTNETGWVSGRGTGALTLEMFDVTEAVGPGDRVLTAGGRFPPDLVVGTITDAARAEAGFALRTSVEPIIDVGKLDFVKVLIETRQGEQAEDVESVPVEELPTEVEPLPSELLDGEQAPPGDGAR